MSKMPIWAKDPETGKWVRIPYEAMTTFRDGERGFTSPVWVLDTETFNFYLKFRRYFKEREVDSFTTELLFTGKKQYTRKEVTWFLAGVMACVNIAWWAWVLWH